MVVDQQQAYQQLTKELIVSQCPNVFQGTGKMEGQYHLELEEGAVPIIHPPRKVPVALKTQLKDEVTRLENLGILAKVTEPTPWVSCTSATTLRITKF